LARFRDEVPVDRHCPVCWSDFVGVAICDCCSEAWIVCVACGSALTRLGL
jgi:hypothetical protein